MTITYHRDLVQGSDEWGAARCGLLTASEMKLILTPGKLQAADNDKTRAHLYELLAQRITRYVEPSYISDDMLRGMAEESEAKHYYATHFAPVEDCGIITNDRWGFTIGYSPDGLVGELGLVECKSRRQKFQVETILAQAVPAEFMLQLQTGLLVSERSFIDFVSFSGGLPLDVQRVHSDDVVQDAIVTAATAFEDKLAEKWAEYDAILAQRRVIMTERHIEQEMYI